MLSNQLDDIFLCGSHALQNKMQTYFLVVILYWKQRSLVIEFYIKTFKGV